MESCSITVCLSPLLPECDGRIGCFRMVIELLRFMDRTSKMISTSPHWRRRFLSQRVKKLGKDQLITRETWNKHFKNDIALLVPTKTLMTPCILNEDNHNGIKYGNDSDDEENNDHNDEQEKVAATTEAAAVVLVLVPVLVVVAVAAVAVVAAVVVEIVAVVAVVVVVVVVVVAVVVVVSSRASNSILYIRRTQTKQKGVKTIGSRSIIAYNCQCL